MRTAEEHQPTAAGQASPGPRAAAVLIVLFLASFALTSSLSGPRNEPACLSAQCLALRIDPNGASRAELMLLPGIGPKIADNIIEYRDAQRPHVAFRRPEDLEQVARIGPATVENLRAYLCFPESDADTDAGANLP
ncbi:MAG: helix-hairpin-helix domain-containing protein [Planctomycetes bacterium]|nr:helix-hairpin-helix domain-containing protein [Planctomycetota bacterium]